MSDPLMTVLDVIRESATGEQCALQIPGVCRGEVSATVFLPEGDGPGGCYACPACRAAIDAREGWKAGEREQRMRQAQTRTLRRLHQKGLLRIAG